jgi:hypothetical protein
MSEDLAVHLHPHFESISYSTPIFRSKISRAQNLVHFKLTLTPKSNEFTESALESTPYFSARNSCSRRVRTLVSSPFVGWG